MRSAQILRVMAAGFLATLAMTIAMYTVPIVAVQQVDLAALLGSLLGQQRPAPQSWSWWLGLGLHVINGSLIFPLVYAYLFSWLSGLWWGVLLWIVAEMIFMPLTGMGIFATKAPLPLVQVMGSLVVHLIYGAILGALVGHLTTRQP